MLLFTELHVNKHIQADLCKIGLSTYKQFITYDGGELVSRYLKNPVRKIQVNINGIQKAFFLKQSQTPPPMKRVIRTILTGRLPHTTAYGEMLAAQYYQKLGIPVMNPVCWGEQRKMGRPISGFLMVEEIKGRNIELRYIDSTYKVRKKLAYGYGRLIGYMHKNNVYDDVRCEEVICSSDNVMDFRSSMKIIDRERGRRNKKRFPESDSKKLVKRAISLAQTLLVDSRSHILPIPSHYDLLAFLAGYFAENSDVNKKARMKLLNMTRDVLNTRIEDRERYKRFKEIELLIRSF